MKKSLQSHRLLPWPALAERVPYTRQHIMRLEAEGKFPARVQVGGNWVAWLESEVNAWIEAPGQRAEAGRLMAPPETRRGAPRQERPSIASNSNNAQDDSTNAIALSALSEIVAAALARGLLIGGGRFELRSGLLRRAAGG